MTGVFSLSQQLLNTLRGGMIAAYDQATPRNRVRWTAVIPELVTTFSGKAWWYWGVRVEVTFDSYLEVQRQQEAQEDFETGNVLMVTGFEKTRLLSLEEVNAFLGWYVPRPAWVRAAEHVEFPDDFRDMGSGGYLVVMLDRRRVVAAVLYAQRHDLHVRVAIKETVLVGWVLDVNFMTCRLSVGHGHVFDVSLWTRKPCDLRVMRDGGFVPLAEYSSSTDLDQLPVWSYQEGQWLGSSDGLFGPPADDLDRVSIRGRQALGAVAFRRLLRVPRHRPPGD